MWSFETCTQPECLLREDHVDSHFLAKLIVRVLSGEEIPDSMAERPPIYPEKRCVDCALRIMGGGHALPSVAEVQELLEAGRWSHRRLRRGARRDQREQRESTS